MFCSLRGWIASPTTLLEPRAYSERLWNCYSGRSFFGNPYTVESRKDGQLIRVAILPEDTEVRIKVGNSVENKGFSTALTLRLGSTIPFGHASAARDP